MAADRLTAAGDVDGRKLGVGVSGLLVPPRAAGSRTDGLVLAAKVTTDLGVAIGDTVTFEHPQPWAR